MNIDTKAQNLPNLIADLLGKDGLNIDNLFAILSQPQRFMRATCYPSCKL
jgi:hypothetical protein